MSDPGADLDPIGPIEPIEPPDDLDCPDPEEGPAERGISGLRADQRGWGAGWPTDNRARTAVVAAAGTAVRVRAELASLVAWLMDETATRGYALHHGQCWGFANRPIRGSNRPSNHSWGLAVDLNAPANPMTDHLVTDMPAWMVELWTSKGFRWGGDYRGRKDAMHYEFMGTPDDAAGFIAGLAAPVDVPPAPPAPPPPAQPPPAPPVALPVLKRGAKGDAVRTLQARLVARGAAVAVDGDFGPATETAVKAFQQANRLVADGVVGPRTWAALG